MNELTTITPVTEESVSQPDHTAIAPYIRPPHVTPVYTEDELRAKMSVDTYLKRIYCVIPQYKSGQANYSQLTLLQYANKFFPFLEPLQQSVAKKIAKQYERNGKVGRTSLMQLFTCIGSIDKDGDGLSFPQERIGVGINASEDYRWYLNAIAEAQQLLELMNKEADKLREQSHRGNIHFVDRLS